MPYDCVLGAWRAHESELRRFLGSRLDTPDDAEDLVQEIFVRSLRQGAGFCELTNPRAWLFQVARNALVDRARAARPHLPLSDAFPSVSPDDPAAILELAGCLRRNLDQMTPDDRTILEQCDLEGVLQRDFAAAHSLTVPAVKSRLLRARRRLRDVLIRNCQVRFDDTGRICCHLPPDTDPPAV